MATIEKPAARDAVARRGAATRARAARPLDVALPVRRAGGA